MNIDFLQTNVDITNLSNFRTLAYTRYYFEIHNRQDIDKIEEIIKFARNNNLKILFIWWWTNLLFAFDTYEWIIIKNCLEWRSYDKDTKILEVFSWEKIWELAKNLETQYWQDLWHRFIWLPWTVWWAVFGNAWCFWLEIESNFVETEVLDLESWIIETLNKEQVSFSYRSSIFKETKKYFIIQTKFDLNEKIEKYSSDVDNIDFRENKQPKWNSWWSFFKNPSTELSAWSAIEAVWLKWYHYNRVFFSDKHANFLINDKEWWSWQDLLFLIDLAKTKVKAKFKVELEPEVRIIR